MSCFKGCCASGIAWALTGTSEALNQGTGRRKHVEIVARSDFPEEASSLFVPAEWVSKVFLCNVNVGHIGVG